MISLKELTLVDEAIKCLGYTTLKYIKVDPYAHPNWICNTIHILFLISFQELNFYFQWVLWFDRIIRQNDVVSCNVMEN
jgi:hypothetical protein